MNLKDWWYGPKEFVVIPIIAFVGCFLILFIGFLGEYQDWDGERAAKSRYVGDKGYQMKCIKECVECHAKVGYPLNKNMKHNLKLSPSYQLSL